MTTFGWIILALLPGLIAYPIILDRFGNSRESERSKWEQYLIYISRAIIFSVFWPIIGLLVLIDKMVRKRDRMRSVVQEMKDLIAGKSWNDGKLRFWNMGGMGDFYCKDCHYSQEVVSFLHGFGEDPWSNSGYQCQKCGKFLAIEYDHKLDTIPDCECGGNLSRENALFCPVCRSLNVGYHMTLIT